MLLGKDTDKNHFTFIPRIKHNSCYILYMVGYFFVQKYLPGYEK